MTPQQLDQAFLEWMMEHCSSMMQANCHACQEINRTVEDSVDMRRGLEEVMKFMKSRINAVLSNIYRKWSNRWSGEDQARFDAEVEAASLMVFKQGLEIGLKVGRAECKAREMQ